MNNKHTRDSFSLKETSDLLGIPASTILFWERKGLLDIARSESNNYRRFRFMDHATLTDINFYKHMGLSLSEIKQLHTMHPDDLFETLYFAKKRTKDNIQALLQMEDEIDKRIEVLHTLHYLQQIQYQRSDLPIAGAIPLYAASELNYHELLQDL